MRALRFFLAQADDRNGLPAGFDFIGFLRFVAHAVRINLRLGIGVVEVEAIVIIVVVKVPNPTH